ncbi:MAG: ABC transporter ATP-binding protein [Ignavibacteria bacterium]|nr:ABC transporter ATP-binding protein [Ignavibacteria bacterium]
MINISVSAENLCKNFGRRFVFKNLNFIFDKPGIYGIAGINGSGKTTLAKIISGVLSPSQGKIYCSVNSLKINPEEIQKYIGYAAPYVVFYDEFTAYENLKMLSVIQGIDFNSNRCEKLLTEFGLYERRNEHLSNYSSGMKQRIKIIFAMMNNLPLIIFDEPITNLDSAGKEIFYRLLKQQAINSLIIIASNEEADLALCSKIIIMENFRK